MNVLREQWRAALMGLGLAIGCLLGPSGTRAADTITYFHNDPFGTPLLATDANGAVVWKENYRPYGEKLNNDPASAGNRIGFTGKPYDSNTGLSYMGARYYDPAIGRFTGIDPKGANPNDYRSFNLYAYGNNNPYKFVDPDGHSPLDVGFLIYDLGNLGYALYSGHGAGEALVGVGLSVVGVISPVPGVSVALKAARAVEHAAEVAKVAKVANEVNEARHIAQEAGAAARGTSDVAKKAPVVIGESMEKRVIPTADQIGGHIYKPKGEWTEAKQLRWAKDMKGQVDRGERDLVDIGRDRLRPMPSEAYSIERRVFYGEK